MGEFDRFLSAPGMPESVGLQVDLTHFHHKGQDVPAVLEHWRDRLWDVHTSDCIVHDWHGADSYVARMLDEVHWPVGRGTVDFLRIIETLKRMGYDRWLTLELYPRHVESLRDILESREVLEQLLGSGN
jgi:sugar phosphate isomerase/epimerase